MKLQEALKLAQCPMGLTSIVSGLLSGDTASITRQDTVKLSREEVEKQIVGVRLAQEHCGSDAAWWGYNSQLATLKATRDILEAAELVGAENLPDVTPPETDGVVMDIQFNIENFGRNLLAEARRVLAKEKKK